MEGQDENLKLPSKNLERKLFDKGYKTIAATDEVGIGPLAGPTVACAVVIEKKFFFKNIRRKRLSRLRDSKQLTPKKRLEYFQYLTSLPEIDWRVAFVQPVTIDRINIYHAARLAMRRAIERLNKKPDIVLIDGKTKIKGITTEQLPIIKGDQKVFSIACASVIAKVMRDRYMERKARNYPQYSFEKHKGYGTRLHKARLVKHGVCPLHRTSFAPVRFVNAKLKTKNAK